MFVRRIESMEFRRIWLSWVGEWAKTLEERRSNPVGVGVGVGVGVLGNGGVEDRLFEGARKYGCLLRSNFGWNWGFVVLGLGGDGKSLRSPEN